MNIDELHDRLTAINQALAASYPDLSDREVIMAKTMKLMEELGELTDEILSSLQLQREGKLLEYQRDNLKKEWSDVLLSLLLLGIQLDIDFKESINSRIIHIQKRLGIDTIEQN